MSFADNAAYFSQARIIPILTPRSVAKGIELSRVLFAVGFRLLEVTLRTEAAVDTIATLKRELPELAVGAGTVLTPQQGNAALQAGARFLVSPGATETLLKFAMASDVPFLPGVSTVSEIMRVQELGCTVAKLYPARLLGGTAFLESLSGLVPSMKFCPTGDIDARLAPSYLQLNNVLAVGGSWMASDELDAVNDWQKVARLAEQAFAL